MGEVYRARDTKLGRDVAITTLAASTFADTESLTRFRREAHLLAALNHPNVATIHAIEEAGSTLFLVLELVDGDTLDQLVARGPLPLEPTLEIARQVIAALDAAHEHGIVHRDLKPSNIALTKNGVVKVLDFGLAKRDRSTLPSFRVHPRQRALRSAVRSSSPGDPRHTAASARQRGRRSGDCCRSFRFLTNRYVHLRERCWLDSLDGRLAHSRRKDVAASRETGAARQQPMPRMNVLLNFFDEIRRLSPAE
jgi:serine/threonine protein kinase